MRKFVIFIKELPAIANCYHTTTNVKQMNHTDVKTWLDDNTFNNINFKNIILAKQIFGYFNFDQSVLARRHYVSPTTGDQILVINVPEVFLDTPAVNTRGAELHDSLINFTLITVGTKLTIFEREREYIIENDDIEHKLQLQRDQIELDRKPIIAHELTLENDITSERDRKYERYCNEVEDVVIEPEAIVIEPENIVIDIRKVDNVTTSIVEMTDINKPNLDDKHQDIDTIIEEITSLDQADMLVVELRGGKTQTLTGYVQTLPEIPNQYDNQQDSRMNDYKRKQALSHIWLAIQKDQNINVEDIRNLSREDLDGIKTIGDEYLIMIIRENENELENEKDCDHSHENNGMTRTIGDEYLTKKIRENELEKELENKREKERDHGFEREREYGFER